VPLIARWKGKVQANTETDHISAFWDFMPTACEVAGVQAPAYTDGISYLPVLLGEKQEKHEVLYWEFPAQGGKQALRHGKWKGVRTGLLEDPNAPLELYDLSTDIGETKDVSKENPEVAKKVLEMMDEQRVPDPNWPLFKNEFE
jgi:arylsulfatase A-like enzyme